MRRSVMIIMAVIFALLTACGPAANSTTSVPVVGKQVSVAGGSYTDVSVAELQSMLENKDFAFINVHIPFEGNIADTDLSIPYDQIDQNLDQLPDKDAKVVLYCRSGRMSAIAAETLVSQGYTNVWNLSGGMVAWEQAGLTIEQ
ncbi:MAG: rhodanese-like domain-containing protein [Acidobacteriaceae bacterium]